MVTQIKWEESAEVTTLFQESYPDNWFSEHMVQTGKYFGVRDSKRFGNTFIKVDNISNKLISVGGVHVYSAEFGIATLGNITTHPGHRGKGIAKQVVVAIVKSLLSDLHSNGEVQVICKF
jgi:hypothetical protein